MTFWLTFPGVFDSILVGRREIKAPGVVFNTKMTISGRSAGEGRRMKDDCEPGPGVFCGPYVRPYVRSYVSLALHPGLNRDCSPDCRSHQGRHLSRNCGRLFSRDAGRDCGRKLGCHVSRNLDCHQGRNQSGHLKSDVSGHVGRKGRPPDRSLGEQYQCFLWVLTRKTRRIHAE